MNDFRKYATKHLGINGMVLDDVVSQQAQYLNPYILEERQLNVTQMDVFSRLMMDRIIFLGTQIDDYTANTLQAQLLYLDSVDPGKDISIYINSPGGSVTAGLGIYDTMQFAQYGMSNVPDEYLDNYVLQIMKDEKNLDSYVERASDVKLAEALKKVVKLNEKTVTLDEFNKLMSEK